MVKHIRNNDFLQNRISSNLRRNHYFARDFWEVILQFITRDFGNEISGNILLLKVNNLFFLNFQTLSQVYIN